MTDDQRDVAVLAAKLAQAAKSGGAVIATAESCTAGLVSSAITEIPGSSAWFDRGFVTYTAESKCEMLGVSPETIEKHGVVSEETALEMAMGAIKRSRANVAVSLTGIAGPGGAEPGKPVGTVCFGLVWPKGHKAITRHFTGDRHQVRIQAVAAALFELRCAVNS